jgi:hypothetical protein
MVNELEIKSTIYSQSNDYMKGVKPMSNKIESTNGIKIDVEA